MTNNNGYMGLINFILKRFIWVITAVVVAVLAASSYIYFFLPTTYSSKATMIIRKIEDTGYPGHTGYLNTSEFNVYSNMINDCSVIVKSRYFYDNIKSSKNGFNEISYDEYTNSVSIEPELDSNTFHVVFETKKDVDVISIVNAISKGIVDNYYDFLVKAEVKIIDKALFKESSFKRDLVVYSVAAAMAGAGLAIIFIFLWYFMCPYVKSKYDLESKHINVDSIYQLPAVSEKKYNEFIKGSTKNLQSKVSSAYKFFELYITNKQNPIKTLLVTSTSKDTNKSQFCTILSRFLNEKKANIAVLNLDISDDYKDYSNKLDINKFITGDYSQEKTEINLFTVNRSSIINEETLMNLIKAIKSDSKYDFIILNAPPILEDNIIINNYEEFDKVILTISEMKTIKESAVNAIELLESYVNNSLIVNMKI